MPLYVSVFVKEHNVGLSKLLSNSKKTILDIEQALSSGEIINYNPPLSRDSAIQLLKEKKELMDLELISKEEYDVFKNNLKSIILD